MMVVAPTFQDADSSITMPEINSGISIEQKNATISVSKAGDLYLNGTAIKKEELVQALVELKPALEEPEVVVKADTQVKSSEIMNIMNAAQEAEFKKLIVAGEPLSKKEQKELQKQNGEVNG